MEKIARNYQSLNARDKLKLSQLSSPVDFEEEKRLLILRNSNILDIKPDDNDPDFDRISCLGARIFKTDVLLIEKNLITSKAGSQCNTIFGDDYSREGSICTYTVLPESPDIFLVPDISKDERFSHLSKTLGLYYYAGSPIILDDMKIGALCILDTKPHPGPMSTEDRMNLLDLSAIVSSMVKQKRDRNVDINQERAKLVHDISHNLRSPLQSLNLGIDVLQTENKDNPHISRSAKEATEDISHAGQQLETIVESSLHMVRIMAQNDQTKTTKRETCNLVNLIEATKRVSVCMKQNLVDHTVWKIESLLNKLGSNIYQETYPDAIQFCLFSILSQLTDKCSFSAIQFDFDAVSIVPVQMSNRRGLGLARDMVADSLSGDLCITVAAVLDGRTSQHSSMTHRSFFELVNFSGIGHIALQCGGRYDSLDEDALGVILARLTPETLHPEHFIGIQFWFPCHQVSPNPSLAAQTIAGGPSLSQPLSRASLDSAVPRPSVTVGGVEGDITLSAKQTDKGAVQVTQSHMAPVPPSSTVPSTTNALRHRNLSDANTSLSPVRQTSPASSLPTTAVQVTDAVAVSASRSASPDPVSVLIIEDSLSIQKTMRRWLERNGCEVTVADNGKIGLECLKNKSYLLVCVDFLMPVMTGLECLYEWKLWTEARKSKKEPFLNEHSLIVGMSATASAVERVDAHRFGMHFFAPKPASSETLSLLVNKSKENLSKATVVEISSTPTSGSQRRSLNPNQEYLNAMFEQIKENPKCGPFQPEAEDMDDFMPTIQIGRDSKDKEFSIMYLADGPDS